MKIKWQRGADGQAKPVEDHYPRFEAWQPHSPVDNSWCLIIKRSAGDEDAGEGADRQGTRHGSPPMWVPLEDIRSKGWRATRNVYSTLNVSRGSVPAAFKAGTRLARSAAPARIATTLTSVVRSMRATP